MKKHVFAIIFVAGSFFLAAGDGFTAAKQPEQQSVGVNELLVGRWELCTPEGKPMETPKVRQKIYTKKSYVVLEVDKESNTTYVDFIGKITPEGEDKMDETVVCTHSQLTSMLSRSFKFFYKVDGNRLYLKGIDNAFNEIWVRISD
jgi:hypothetical protein